MSPAGPCGRRRRQALSRASSDTLSVGFSGVGSGWDSARAAFGARQTSFRCWNAPLLRLPIPRVVGSVDPDEVTTGCDLPCTCGPQGRQASRILGPSRVGCSRSYEQGSCAASEHLASRVVGKTAGRIRCVVALGSAGFLQRVQSVRVSGSSRLPSLTWIRSWNLPFVAAGREVAWGLRPAVAGGRRSTARHGLQPDRLGLAGHSRAARVGGPLEPDRVGDHVRCAEPPCAQGSD